MLHLTLLDNPVHEPRACSAAMTWIFDTRILIYTYRERDPLYSSVVPGSMDRHAYTLHSFSNAL